MTTTTERPPPPPPPSGAAAATTVPPAALEQSAAEHHSELPLSNSALLESVYVPSETELTLLCWDYLRQDCLRRNKHAADATAGTAASKSNAYQTLACWALYQSLVTAEQSAAEDSNNDTEQPQHRDILDTLPSLNEMQSTLMRYQESSFTDHSHGHQNTTALDEETKETKEADEDFVGHSATTTITTPSEHFYDDAVLTPLRLFPAHGLAEEMPLSLTTVATAGCLLLSATSRRAAEMDFMRTPLFGHFCAACHTKGFFAGPTPPNTSSNGMDNTGTNNNNADPTSASMDPKDPLFRERFAKVVTKFRQKLLHHQYAPPLPPALVPPGVHADSVTSILEALAYTASTAAALQDEQQGVYQHSTMEESSYILAGGVVPIPSAYISSRRPMVGPDSAWTTATAPSTPLQLAHHQQSESNGQPPTPLSSSPFSTAATRTILGTTPPSSSTSHSLSEQQQCQGHHPDDLADAEAFKQKGNTHMQRQEYQLAWDCYTAALSRSPSGPQSHVYYANRAAAAVSLQRWADAVADAQRSLALSPDYAKAHARLGLTHFLQGQYRHAVSAYTAALKYEPDNASSRHYLTKAAQRLAAEEQAGTSNTLPPPPPLSSAPSTDGTHTSHNETNAAMRQVPSNSSWSSRAGDSVKSHSGHSHNGGGSGRPGATTTTNSTVMPPLTAAEREAELAKSQGNALMASRDYAAALQAYTRALASSATGPQSHVYYANRAAAYCYLERYTDARDDAVAALALQPTYGKAHARLGLALFCSKDYAGAVAAYETALVHDPHNTAAQSYLHKAQAKVAKAAAAAAASGNSNKGASTTRPLSSSRPQRQEH
jgi:tetratricopeptide (TPR) repeat protein